MVLPGYQGQLGRAPICHHVLLGVLSFSLTSPPTFSLIFFADACCNQIFCKIQEQQLVVFFVSKMSLDSFYNSDKVVRFVEPITQPGITILRPFSTPSTPIRSYEHMEEDDDDEKWSTSGSIDIDDAMAMKHDADGSTRTSASYPTDRLLHLQDFTLGAPASHGISHETQPSKERLQLLPSVRPYSKYQGDQRQFSVQEFNKQNILEFDPRTTDTPYPMPPTRTALANQDTERGAPDNSVAWLPSWRSLQYFNPTPGTPVESSTPGLVNHLATTPSSPYMNTPSPAVSSYIADRSASNGNELSPRSDFDILA